MPKSNKKNCQICEKQFSTKDLFPVSLIRHSVLLLAKKTYPDLDEEGWICLADVRKLNAMHLEELIKKEKGTLTELEREVIDSIKNQELLTENVNTEFTDQLTFGERVSDKIADFGGSWKFILSFLAFLVVWMAINTVYFLTNSFDPYPFILLNLILSTLAALQAPVIMMSQNRQASKDRLNMEHDYMTNLKSELQIRQLNARIELFMKHYWQTMLDLHKFQEELVQQMNADNMYNHGKKKSEE